MRIDIPHLTIFFLLLIPLLLVGCLSPETPAAVATPTAAAPNVEATRAEPAAPQSRPEAEATATLLAVQESESAEDTSQSPTESPADHGNYESLLGAPRYNIQLDLDYLESRYAGSLILDYTNLEDIPQDVLFFRLFPNGGASYGNGSLRVTEVLVDGNPVEMNLSLDDTVLEVVLPNPLPVGEQLQLELSFQGQVPRDFGGEDTPSGYGIYNLSQGVMALSGWYPILAVYDDEGWNLDPVSPIGDSVYSDMAFYIVEINADNDLIIAATGDEIGKDEQDQLTSYRYESGPARDFFLIMSPDFEVTSREVDGTLVNSYYLPGHEAAGKDGLEIAADSLQVFNRRFGVYPYRELDLVEAPMRNALGVEYPGIILVASSLYDDTSDPTFSVATAHEVAHQWWYNLVGNDVIEHPWLDEALTTYSSSLYFEDKLGPGAARGLIGYWEDRYSQLVADGLDDLITEDLVYFEGLPERRVYGGVVYTKGGLFFKELRDEIGDQAFFEALQAYFQKYQYQVAEPEDLLEAFEEAAGRSLQDFYQQWLYSTQ